MMILFYDYITRYSAVFIILLYYISQVSFAGDGCYKLLYLDFILNSINIQHYKPNKFKQSVAQLCKAPLMIDI